MVTPEQEEAIRQIETLLEERLRPIREELAEKEEMIRDLNSRLLVAQAQLDAFASQPPPTPAPAPVCEQGWGGG